jgi:tetratricopeptide (TPR) repeat protein
MRRNIILFASLAVVAMTARPGWVTPASDQDPAFIQALSAAKAALQVGINRWEADGLQKARDLFIGLLLKQEKPSPYLHYYVALADYRQAAFHLSSGSPAEADRYVTEGEQYLEKTMEAEPEFGEAFSLYGFLLGLEIALHQDRAMILGFKSMASLDQGIEKEPSNPRTHLIKGMYLPYVPEEFGGGVDKAIPYLEKAISLFAGETDIDPIKPSWGRDEAHLHLGMAYKAKGDTEKAKEWLKKALALNPDLGLAKSLLASLEKGR